MKMVRHRMIMLKMLLVLCLVIPLLSLAAGLAEDKALPQTCYVEAMTPLIIYQPDDVLLKNFAPYQKKIRALSDYLKLHPVCGLRLEGHVDQRKSSEYSFGLAQRYADSVQKYLVSQGFDSDRISAVSMGKEKPAVAGNNRKARAKSRRVEVSLYQLDVKHGSTDVGLSGPR